MQRKIVEVTWDVETIRGQSASIQAAADGEEFEEVRNVENDGKATVTFPEDYFGTCSITVKGSVDGEMSGSFEVI